MIFLIENVPVMAERDVYTAYMSSHPGLARGVPGRAVTYAGLDHGCIWGKGCQAVLRLTSRRCGEEARKVQ